ncbi:MAG: hypothetical protein AAFN18_08200 [Cyanobacteria bacterium J06554_6]
MNSDSDRYRDMLDWLWQIANAERQTPFPVADTSSKHHHGERLFTGRSSTAIRSSQPPTSSISFPTPPEVCASEVGSEAVSSEYWDPLESEDLFELTPRFLATSPSHAAFETAQSFNFGEISPVQDRFHTLLKNRLRLEFENRPLLFPWESELSEYPVDLPSMAGAAAARPWIDNLRQLQVASALPEAILTQLLERCQVMARSSKQQGVKLIRTVESLFPENTDLLEPIAGIVLTPAYRGDDARATAIQELEALASDYDAATTEQQIAISMLAAQEIMAALTLTVSEQAPRLTREWVTAQGLLKLEINYDSDLLFVRVYCPGNSRVNLQDGDVTLQATRTQPGRLDLVKAAPKIGHNYVLEVSLPDSGHRALRFALSVLADEG